MTTGLSVAGFANLILAALDTTTANVITSHVQPHTADPGSAGTTSVFTSVVAQRAALTWDTTGSGTRGISAPSEWSVNGTGTVSHISTWNASSSGTFRFSAALTTPRDVAADDTLRLTSLTFTFTPLAA
jgi:hypothetical protein